jgi:hypothetical protein
MYHVPVGMGCTPFALDRPKQRLCLLSPRACSRCRSCIARIIRIKSKQPCLCMMHAHVAPLVRCVIVSSMRVFMYINARVYVTLTRCLSAAVRLRCLNALLPQNSHTHRQYHNAFAHAPCRTQSESHASTVACIVFMTSFSRIALLLDSRIHSFMRACTHSLLHSLIPPPCLHSLQYSTLTPSGAVQAPPPPSLSHTPHAPRNCMHTLVHRCIKREG